MTNKPEIEAVIFDVGETIIDETREYGTWADWLGVPRHTFSATFGACIAAGQDYREVFQKFRPGFELSEERQKRIDRGEGETFGEEDIYPDVRQSLADLSLTGIEVGFAGNQTARAGRILRTLFPDLRILLTSDELGYEKPDSRFFVAVADKVGVSAEGILYVGDRLDNDIDPAQKVGMQTAFIRRGPWGYNYRHPAIETVDYRIESLLELAPIVSANNQGRTA